MMNVRGDRRLQREVGSCGASPRGVCEGDFEKKANEKKDKKTRLENG